MSTTSQIANAFATSAAPLVVASFASAPPPAEAGLLGQIADEQARYENAKAWRETAPAFAFVAGLVGGAWLAYAVFS